MGKYGSRLIFVFIILLITYYISQNHFQLMLIQGSSMEPEYHNMQLVFIEKDYDIDELQVGDVIAFRCDKLNTVLVKRIAAVPGQEVVIKDKTLWINESPSMYYEEGVFEYAGRLAEVKYLEEDEFVVIGDNVLESKDSRYEEIGNVRFDRILGVIR